MQLRDQEASRLFAIRHQRRPTDNELFLFAILDRFARDLAHRTAKLERDARADTLGTLRQASADLVALIAELAEGRA